MSVVIAGRRDRAATLAVMIGVVVVHLWLSSPLPGPSLLWDGTAYLSVSRWLAGEVTPQLGHLGHYSVGYPLLLVPVVWVTSSLEQLFDGVRIVNAVAIASTVPAMVMLGMRVGGLARPAALALAGPAAVLPALALQSGFEWAESVLVAALVWSAVAAVAWAEHPSTRRAVVLGLASAGAYSIHPRGFVAVVATAVLMALTWRRDMAGLVVMVAGVGAAALLNEHAVATLWNPATSDQSTAIVDAVTTPSMWGEIATRGIGQAWYVLVATAALAPLGVTTLVAVAAGRRPAARTLAGWWILIGLVATIGLSVAKLATVHRADHLVYGRYLDPWLAILFVLGAGSLTTMRARRALAAVAGGLAGAAVLAVAVVALNDTDAFDGPFLPLNILGVLAFDEPGNNRIDVARITVIGLIAGALVAGALVLVRRHAVVTALVLVVAAGAASVVAADDQVESFAAIADRAFVLASVLDLVDADAPVAYDMAVFDARGANRYSLAERDRTFSYFDSRRGERPRHDLVIAGKDPAEPPAPGARIVFPEPAHEQTLWVLRGPMQRRLAARGFLIPTLGDEPGAGFANGRVEIVDTAHGDVVVRVTKTAGGAPWVAPDSLPTAGGEVEVQVTIAGMTARTPLPRTLLPGDEIDVVVRAPRAPAGEHVVRVTLVGDHLPPMPRASARVRLP